ncbi:hypothetical protein ACFX2I_028484 [Malus domestica]
MASSKAQAVPVTNAKNKSILVAGGVTSGIITRSKARALSASSSTPESLRKYSGSMLFDAGSSGSSAMQVMTTGATSIDEQLAHMNETIARLTRTVEEKDSQIAALVNQLEAHHDEKPDLKGNAPKRGADEEGEPPAEKVEEKPEPNQAMTFMGYLSI